MKPREILHFLTDQIHHTPPNVSDHFQHQAEYAPAPHDIPDTQEGFDIDGNYHRLASYSESADVFVERTEAAQLGRTALNRWDDQGDYYRTDL